MLAFFSLVLPVIIDGVTISRATLHNKDEIERKDLREKDLIELQRAGEVIPQILRVREWDVCSIVQKIKTNVKKS